ncbi:uncharacterized protein LOC112903830 [Panicum hallii]|uniref:uncharacterized protein LOC112903830 n=1 Tax=Panicum hallii TaxID=206008 RepID=UPI000DF4EE82|nr:uncharacterized protein LOC112903830 [Panicum hallii]
MEAAYPDWSALPEDLIALVLRVLDIPDLFRAGAVCLPAPAFRSRYVVGSGHGWVVTADEESNLQLLNPLTTAQLDLPPVTGLHHVESFTDEQGRSMYNLYGDDPWLPDFAMPFKPKNLRLFLYHRAYVACRPSAGAACVVLLLCRQNGELNFARLGDDRWTHVAESEFVRQGSGYRGAAYNDKDDRSVVLAPWGDMLQVWRHVEVRWSENLQVSAEIADEVICPTRESYTDDFELYKVDVHDQKLVKVEGGSSEATVTNMHV